MYRTLWAAFVIAGLALAPTRWQQDAAQEPDDAADGAPDCVYVGTPYDVIDKMLEMGSIGKGDLVYDLGCGDGRIVVAAARRYGCRGVGYDINPQRIKESLQNSQENQVAHLVKIEKQDIFQVDVRPASVIMLYLLPEMNLRLLPQLEKLKPGSRIVTHDYDIEGVTPDRFVKINCLEDGVEHYVYLYKTPLQKADP